MALVLNLNNNFRFFISRNKYPGLRRGRVCLRAGERPEPAADPGAAVTTESGGKAQVHGSPAGDRSHGDNTARPNCHQACHTGKTSNKNKFCLFST